MKNSSRPFSELADLRIERVDPGTGRLMNSWKFTQRCEITIGRAPEQDVEIHDPYVSRHHVTLALKDGAWTLIALGRNGVMVKDQIVQNHQIESELEFQLGPQGPLLRVTVPQESAGPSIMGTMVFDHSSKFSKVEDETSAETELFNLDKQRLQQEVTEIAESDYFQRLQQLAAEMRQRRNQ